MAIGHKLQLRLFLEGIEVPVIGAQVQCIPNAPIAASIQVIATDNALLLLPRTVVHLFFYDFVDATSPLPGSPLNDPGSLGAQKLEDEQYKLIFMGEVQGISFAKSAGNRSAILSCVDFSNYWDTTYQYNFKGDLVAGRQQANLAGANTNYLKSPLGHGTGTVGKLLRSRSVNFPQLKGLMAGIIRTLEAIGGSYYGSNTFRGANDFCALAELRLKLLQQVAAPEGDTSSLRLFSRKEFSEWIDNRIGQLGRLVTFRGLIQLIQRFIYHDMYPQPAPLFVEGVSRNAPTPKVWRDITSDGRPYVKRFLVVLSRMLKEIQSARSHCRGFDRCKWQRSGCSSSVSRRP